MAGVIRVSLTACYYLRLMKTLVKFITVWLLLFAVPAQTLAAAAMMACAPSQPMSSHAQMTQAEHADMAAMPCCPDKADPKSQPVKPCAACAACCIGVAMTTVPVGIQAPTLFVSAPNPVYQVSFLSFVSATPERPPQTALI
ncbi:hypothetical protein [Sulfuriferula sp.]|uniref:hypothetical protein n=1 Tax=Sulfuriferula sp. TaxID=2025307 RepID=UPI0027302845|nr:hypothetical protein [Sulfuriferula sp.]MDP2026329.1 hypothetical protein [Sulfuriferula sp.]